MSVPTNEDFVQTTVAALRGGDLDDLALKLITGEDGLDRVILRPRVQKPGLAFAGYYEYIKQWRVQIIGESETKYLQSLPPRLREKRVRDVAALDVSCFIVTKGIAPLEEFRHECEKRGVPLFSTPAMSSTTITRTTYFLEETMAPRITMHAGLIDVFGIGVLLLGDSGIAKPASTRDVKPVDLVVRLEKWVEGTEYDRLGIVGDKFDLLGVSKPYVRLPVASGRNLALLVEIAARNHLMKLQGYDSARAFTQRIDEMIANQGSASDSLPATNRSEVASSEYRSAQ